MKLTAERIMAGAFVALIVMGVVELFAGLVANSIAVISDAIDSFLDAVVVLFVLVGLRVMDRKSDRVFTYGYFRVENLFSLFAAMLMGVTGVLIGYYSYLRLMSTAEPTYTLPVVAIVVINGILSAYMAWMMRRVSKSEGLQSMRVASVNSIKDASSSFVVLVVIGLTALGVRGVDAIGGIVLAAYIISVAYAEVHEASLVLVDALDKPDLRDRIREIIEQTEKKIVVERIRPRRSGPYIFINMKVAADPAMTLAEVGRIKARLEDSIRKALPVVRSITIDFRPSGQPPASSKPQPGLTAK